MHTPPPDHPACVGEDPQLFEFNLFFAAAIDICSTCPVRAWCLRQVDPARHTVYEGVTGGYAWKNGYPQQGNPNDPILAAYVSSRPPRPIVRPSEDDE